MLYVTLYVICCVICYVIRYICGCRCKTRVHDGLRNLLGFIPAIKGLGAIRDEIWTLLKKVLNFFNGYSISRSYLVSNYVISNRVLLDVSTMIRAKYWFFSDSVLCCIHKFGWPALVTKFGQASWQMMHLGHVPHLVPQTNRIIVPQK